MAFSHSRGLHFFHIPKTAGSSIASTFGERPAWYGELPRGCPGYLQKFEYWHHVPFEFANRWQPAHFKTEVKHKAVVVRHPFDRAVSFYFHLLDRVDLGFEITFDEMIEVFDRGEILSGKRKRKRTNVHVYPFNLRETTEYWTGPLEEVRVLRTERLQQDWPEFAREFDLESPLPRLNKTKNRSETKKVLTKNSRKTLEKWHAEDFSRFSFEIF